MLILQYKDKIDHFMYWFFGTICLLYLFDDSRNADVGIWLVAFWAAVTKEFYDGINNTFKEHFLDISAGMVGATLAIILWP